MDKRGRRPEDKTLKEAIARAIRRAVGAKRGRQSKIAKKLGLDRRKFNHYYKGRHRPTDRELLLICRELGIKHIPHKGANYLAGVPEQPAPLAARPYQMGLFDQLKATEAGMKIQVVRADHKHIHLVITIPTGKSVA